MNPQVILPAADALPLPASAILLQFLLQLTFLLHLLAMNAMLGGLLLTLVARIRGGGADSPWTALADSISKVSPSLVASAVTLGVAPLLFLQTLFGQFFFTSSILMAWGWFSIVVVLIFAYYGTYIQSFRGKKLGAAQLPLLAVTVLLFLWISFMFSNNTTLMLNLEIWGSLYFADAGGLHLNLGDGQLWPRWLHMVVGAIALAGLMLAWWGKARLRGGDQSGSFMVRVGVDAFTWFTLGNILLGLWYFMAQPSLVRKLFMGGSTYGTVLFGAGFALSLVVLVLGLLIRPKGDAANLWPISLTTLINLVIMILMRDVVRFGTLGEHYRPAEFAVQPQMMNLVIFAVLLVAGIGVLIWMLRTLYLAWDK
jgi:hypothetical protein